MKIIIDTNFLMICAKHKLDLFSELDNLYGKGAYETIIPFQVINELEMLSVNKRLNLKARNSAKLALEILKLRKIEPTKTEGPSADLAISKYANKENAILATLDAKLKKSVKNKKTRFLTIRDERQVVEA